MQKWQWLWECAVILNQNPFGDSNKRPNTLLQRSLPMTNHSKCQKVCHFVSPVQKQSSKNKRSLSHSTLKPHSFSLSLEENPKTHLQHKLSRWIIPSEPFTPLQPAHILTGNRKNFSVTKNRRTAKKKHRTRFTQWRRRAAPATTASHKRFQTTAGRCTNKWISSASR